MRIFLLCLTICCVSGGNLGRYEAFKNKKTGAEKENPGNYKLPIYPFHIPGEFPITPPPSTTKSPLGDTFENSNFGNGNYKWHYNSDNSAMSQQGYLINSEDDSLNAEQVVVGSYSYTAPDGQLIKISYVADSNGFRPTGNHLPTPVPLPPEYFEAIEQYNKVAANLGVIMPGQLPIPDNSLDSLDPIKIPQYPQLPQSFIPIELPHAINA